ncbi:MAG: CapA family protein [Patescibacteria group bacterium]|jgi:poly-gamma-glutamate synthesis protein (capsule biosynthesis protein)
MSSDSKKIWQRYLWLAFWLLPVLAVFADLFFVGYFFAKKAETRQYALVNQAVKRVEPLVGDLKTTTMIAVGDIMLSRHVSNKMFAVKDFVLPFSRTWEVLSGADITIGNLESPFYNRGDKISSGMVFKAEPEAIAGLNKSGFDVLSIANNHITNQGEQGLNYTVDYLFQSNIFPVGAGADFTAAHWAAVAERNGLKFGFLAYSYADYHDTLGSKYVVAGLNINQAKKDIAALRPKVDVMVVQMHAGEEYTVKPTKTQIDFARAAIDAGADLVIGHHPHWAGTVESYKGKWIFYSLGNFVFDQEWSKETKEGLILQATWKNKDLQELRLIPVIIENYSTPRVVDEVEGKSIFDRIGVTNSVVFSTQDLTE